MRVLPTDTMLALTSDTLGPLEDYRLACLPVPQPGSGEVRLRVEAVALGYVDALIATGRYQHRPPAPYVPGAEIAGTVEALGEGVSGWGIGDRVTSWQLIAGGGVAEFAIAPCRGLVAVPETLEASAAASLLLDYLTAWHALFDRGTLATGETVLVLGAAGGVGAAAVTIAADAGALVIAAASTTAKRDRALAGGATAAIDYLQPDWRDALRAVAPNGVDVVVDPVGGPTFEMAFRSLAKGGRHLILGFAGGVVPHLRANLPLLKNGALIGVDARYLFESRPDRAVGIWQTVFARAAQGRLRPPAIRIYDLDTAKEAFTALGERDRLGKIVIAPIGRLGTR